MREEIHLIFQKIINEKRKKHEEKLCQLKNQLKLL